MSSKHTESPQGTAVRRKKTGPRQIGRYRILRTLGSGGMGTVYLAQDSKLERTVALKVLVKSAETPSTLLKRFHAEARTAAKLRHPHIVTVFDSGEVEGYLFLALEYIDGPDLERVLRKHGKIPVKRSLEIIRQLASALDHAHSVGVVHRDIKPSNVLLRKNGKATLSDLGLARAMGETTASNITRAGYTVGTVDYMAPEQAKSSRAADGRSDLYSLGCTWFHMLTGRIPYPNGDLTNKLRAHAMGPPPDPRTIVPNIPEGIVAIINRLMAQRAEDRYQSAAELLEDLNRPDVSRESLSEEDLWKLAEDAGPAPVGGGISLAEDSHDGEISAGSTMVETAEIEPAPQPPTTAKSPKPQTRKQRSRPHHDRPRTRSSSTEQRPRSPAKNERLTSASVADWVSSWTTGNRLGAVIVLSAGFVLLVIALWIFAHLDAWIAGGPPPPPTSQTPAPMRTNYLSPEVGTGSVTPSNEEGQ